MNRRIKLAFTASILLNIILIGTGAGMAYRLCGGDRFTSDVSAEAQSIISQTFKDGRDKVKPLFEEAHARRDKVEDILTADMFDVKAYDKAVDELLDVREKITRSRADVMEKALTKLSTEDRKQFAKRVLDGLEGNRPKRGGYHNNKPPVDEKPSQAASP